jgi:hypothetical protein
MADLEEDQYMDCAAGRSRRLGIGGTDGRKIEMPTFVVVFLTVDGCSTSEQFSDPRSRRGNVAPNASLRQMPCAHEVRLHHPTSH